MSLLHPRPQLTRSHWTDLGGEWQFTFDDANQGLRERWFEREDVFDRTITVPFPPESPASGIHDAGFHSVLWYRYTFTATDEDRAERLLLHFGAVDYVARVWLNGRLVAEHEGGHVPFVADLTDALRDEAEQVIVVRAFDDPSDLAQPRGKQAWKEASHEIWYSRTSGIWQPVWLERVPDIHIERVSWTPNLPSGALSFQARLSGKDEGLTIQVRLFLRGECLHQQTCTVRSRDVHLSFVFDPAALAMDRSELLWSPQHPNLLAAEITLLKGGETIDIVGSYAGLRSCEARNNFFHLNGVPMYLRLVLAQNFWPESHLAAPSVDALKREVELIKALGFNGMRIHQKVEDPRFLYWCDVLGLLVWEELPAAYVFTEESRRRLTKEWLEVLARDASHPCIVTWVPLNESWGVPDLEHSEAQREFVRSLYHLTRAFDPTRPVIGNDGWQLVAGDLLGIHDYTTEGTVLRERYATRDRVEQALSSGLPGHKRLLMPDHIRKGEPTLLSEFGGLSTTPEEGERWWGYSTLRNGHELLAKYEEMVTAVLDCEGLAGFCYTQLTDTEQESNGLLRADRTPKLDVERVRKVNRRASKALPADVIAEIHAEAKERNRQFELTEMI